MKIEEIRKSPVPQTFTIYPYCASVYKPIQGTVEKKDITLEYRFFKDKKTMRFTDNEAIAIRDWLCGLYGLPKRD